MTKVQDFLFGDAAMASPHSSKTQTPTQREEMLALGQGFVGQYPGGGHPLLMGVTTRYLPVSRKTGFLGFPLCASPS
jgi:hypothetical protein